MTFGVGLSSSALWGKSKFLACRCVNLSVRCLKSLLGKQGTGTCPSGTDNAIGDARGRLRYKSKNILGTAKNGLCRAIETYYVSGRSLSHPQRPSSEQPTQRYA